MNKILVKILIEKIGTRISWKGSLVVSQEALAQCYTFAKEYFDNGGVYELRLSSSSASSQEVLQEDDLFKVIESYEEWLSCFEIKELTEDEFLMLERLELLDVGATDLIRDMPYLA